MKHLFIVLSLFSLAACGNSKQETVEMGSKASLEKSSEVIAERQQQLRESNKRLRENANVAPAKSKTE